MFSEWILLLHFLSLAVNGHTWLLSTPHPALSLSLSLSLSIYIYIYIYIHTHTHTYTYIYIHIYTYVGIYIHICMYIYILQWLFKYFAFLKNGLFVLLLMGCKNSLCVNIRSLADTFYKDFLLIGAWVPNLRSPPWKLLLCFYLHSLPRFYLKMYPEPVTSRHLHSCHTAASSLTWITPPAL